MEDDDVSGGRVTGCPHLLRSQVRAHRVIVPGKRVSGLHMLDALTHHLSEDPSVHSTRKQCVTFLFSLLV